MKAGTALIALALSCCATDRTPEVEGIPVRLFRGDAETLNKLVVAARGCGYQDLKIGWESPHLTPVVSIEISDRTDPRIDCVMRWAKDHPKIWHIG